MGDLNVSNGSSQEDLRRFTKQLLSDVRAMEKMLEAGLFETDIRRIGAEQEFFIVDKRFRPSNSALQVLEALADDHFTPEIAKFNLEFNLDPLPFGGSCLRQLETQITELYAKARVAAQKLDKDVAMVGILPSIRKSDLSLDNMTPFDRYYALNDTITKLRGEDYSFRIKGIDELVVSHDSVMTEACNTSFQLHFQVSPNNFAKYYNFAQAITAPVLAASANSPLLFGNRLWQESRIALFQQAVDTRGKNTQHRTQHGRVSFGTKWVDDSILEIYREDIARFRVLFASTNEEDALAVLDEGGIPKLHALNTHNGTVYRWNRPCYGVSNGVPHLRIENRVIPAGPSAIDATANAAFYFGLMGGISREYDDIRNVMDFDIAKHNFTSAARNGLEAQFQWLDGKTYTAADIIISEMLPMAEYGLKQSGVDAKDIDEYLGIIKERTKSGQTGAKWMLQSFSSLRKSATNDSILESLTSTIVKREKTGKPVHTWDIAGKDDVIEWQAGYAHVDQFMSTDIYTLRESDLVDLAANLMDWQYIRHIPIESDDGKLVGLISYRQIVRQFGKLTQNASTELASLGEIMTKDLLTIPPSTSTIEAIKLMKKHRITCLPVVDEKEQLLGLVRETDFLPIISDLLYKELEDK
jgi:CBS domain-containing protein